MGCLNEPAPSVTGEPVGSSVHVGFEPRKSRRVVFRKLHGSDRGKGCREKVPRRRGVAELHEVRGAREGAVFRGDLSPCVVGAGRHVPVGDGGALSVSRGPLLDHPVAEPRRVLVRGRTVPRSVVVEDRLLQSPDEARLGAAQEDIHRRMVRAGDPPLLGISVGENHESRIGPRVELREAIDAAFSVQ